MPPRNRKGGGGGRGRGFGRGAASRLNKGSPNTHKKRAIRTNKKVADDSPAAKIVTRNIPTKHQNSKTSEFRVLTLEEIRQSQLKHTISAPVVSDSADKPVQNTAERVAVSSRKVNIKADAVKIGSVRKAANNPKLKINTTTELSARSRILGALPSDKDDIKESLVARIQRKQAELAFFDSDDEDDDEKDNKELKAHNSEESDHATQSTPRRINQQQSTNNDEDLLVGLDDEVFVEDQDQDGAEELEEARQNERDIDTLRDGSFHSRRDTGECLTSRSRSRSPARLRPPNQSEMSQRYRTSGSRSPHRRHVNRVPDSDHRFESFNHNGSHDVRESRHPPAYETSRLHSPLRDGGSTGSMSVRPRRTSPSRIYSRDDHRGYGDRYLPRYENRANDQSGSGSGARPPSDQQNLGTFDDPSRRNQNRFGHETVSMERRHDRNNFDSNRPGYGGPVSSYRERGRYDEQVELDRRGHTSASSDRRGRRLPINSGHGGAVVARRGRQDPVQPHRRDEIGVMDKSESQESGDFARPGYTKYDGVEWQGRQSRTSARDEHGRVPPGRYMPRDANGGPRIRRRSPEPTLEKLSDFKRMRVAESNFDERDRSRKNSRALSPTTRDQPEQRDVNLHIEHQRPEKRGVRRRNAMERLRKRSQHIDHHDKSAHRNEEQAIEIRHSDRLAGNVINAKATGPHVHSAKRGAEGGAEINDSVGKVIAVDDQSTVKRSDEDDERARKTRLEQQDASQESTAHHVQVTGHMIANLKSEDVTSSEIPVSKVSSDEPTVTTVVTNDLPSDAVVQDADRRLIETARVEVKNDSSDAEGQPSEKRTLHPFVNLLEDLQTEAKKGGYDVGSSGSPGDVICAKLVTAIHDRLNLGDAIVDVVSMLHQCNIHTWVPVGTIREMKKLCLNGICSTDSRYWNSARQLYSILESKGVAKTDDKFLLLRVAIAANQVSHTYGLLTALRNGPDGVNHLRKQINIEEEGQHSVKEKKAEAGSQAHDSILQEKGELLETAPTQVPKQSNRMPLSDDDMEDAAVDVRRQSPKIVVDDVVGDTGGSMSPKPATVTAADKSGQSTHSVLPVNDTDVDELGNAEGLLQSDKSAEDVSHTDSRTATSPNFAKDAPSFLDTSNEKKESDIPESSTATRDTNETVQSYGNFVYPSLCQLATQAKNAELLVDLARNAVSDCGKPSSTVMASIVDGLASIKLVPASEFLCFLGALVSCGASIPHALSFKILQAQLDRGHLSDAVDIVHDFLFYNTDVLKSDDAADCLAQLCNKSCDQLDRQYLDDIIDLYIWLTRSEPGVAAPLFCKVFSRCVDVRSISRCLIVLQATVDIISSRHLDDDAKNASARLVHVVADICKSHKDVRIKTVLSITQQLGISSNRHDIRTAVDILASTNDWNGVQKMAEPMIVSPPSVEADVLVLDKVIEGMISTFTWDGLHRVFEELVRMQEPPHAEIAAKLATALVNNNMFNDIDCIVKKMSEGGVALPYQFFNGAFEAVQCRFNSDSASDPALDADKVYTVFKSANPVIEKIRSIGNESFDSATLNAESTTTIAGIINCPSWLGPFAHAMVCFKKAGNVEAIHGILAYLDECQIPSNLSFNVYMLEALLEMDVPVAVKSFRIGMRIADRLHCPRSTFFGCDVVFKMLQTLRSQDRTDVGTDMIELLSLLNLHEIVDGISEEHVDDLVAFLLESNQDDAVLYCASKTPLSVGVYVKVINHMKNKSKMAEVCQTFEYSKNYSTPMPSAIYIDVIDAALELSDLTHAIKLYSMFENSLYQHSSGEVPPKALFFRVVKTVGKSTNLREVDAAKRLFEARLSGDLGDEIFSEAPWTVNVASLSPLEVAWVLEFHFKKLRRLRKMYELNIVVGGARASSTALEEECIALLHMLEERYPQLLMSKKPASDSTRIIIEPVDLDSYFFKSQSSGMNVSVGAPKTPPPPPPDVSHEQDIISHPTSTPHAAEAVDLSMVTSLLQSVDEATAKATVANVAPPTLNAEGIRRRNVRDKVAHQITSILKPYYKAKRIKSKEDFKHIGRKFTKQFLDQGNRESTLQAADIESAIPEMQKMVDKLFKKVKVYASESRSRNQEKEKPKS